MTDISVDKVAKFAGLIGVGVLGLTGILAGLGILAYQSYFWLRFGAWHPIAVADFFTWAGVNVFTLTDTKWIGVQKVEFWLLDLPLSAAFPIVGLLACGGALGGLNSFARNPDSNDLR